MDGSMLSPMWYLIEVIQCSIQHEIPAALVFIRKSEEQKLCLTLETSLPPTAQYRCPHEQAPLPCTILLGHHPLPTQWNALELTF